MSMNDFRSEGLERGSRLQPDGLEKHVHVEAFCSAESYDRKAIEPLNEFLGFFQRNSEVFAVDVDEEPVHDCFVPVPFLSIRTVVLEAVNRHEPVLRPEVVKLHRETGQLLQRF